METNHHNPHSKSEQRKDADKDAPTRLDHDDLSDPNTQTPEENPDIPDSLNIREPEIEAEADLHIVQENEDQEDYTDEAITNTESVATDDADLMLYVEDTDEETEDDTDLADEDEDEEDLESSNESDLTEEDLQALGPRDLSMDNGDDELLKHRTYVTNFSGDDLDVPGAELDDADENTGNEDEENNPYSIGGDNHEDLEEDKEYGV